MNNVALEHAARHIDAFDSPLRSRLMVVSLLPNATKKSNGNAAASNGCCARLEMASSISTAFMGSLMVADGTKHSG